MDERLLSHADMVSWEVVHRFRGALPAVCAGVGRLLGRGLPGACEGAGRLLGRGLPGVPVVEGCEEVVPRRACGAPAPPAAVPGVRASSEAEGHAVDPVVGAVALFAAVDEEGLDEGPRHGAGGGGVAVECRAREPGLVAVLRGAGVDNVSLVPHDAC